MSTTMDDAILESASCEECGWTDLSGSQQTPSHAQMHANKTGHEVSLFYKSWRTVRASAEHTE